MTRLSDSFASACVYFERLTGIDADVIGCSFETQTDQEYLVFLRRVCDYYKRISPIYYCLFLMINQSPLTALPEMSERAEHMLRFVHDKLSIPNITVGYRGSNSSLVNYARKPLTDIARDVRTRVRLTHSGDPDTLQLVF